MQSSPWQVFRRIFTRKPARWTNGRRYPLPRTRYLHATTRLSNAPPRPAQGAGQSSRLDNRKAAKEEDRAVRASSAEGGIEEGKDGVETAEAELQHNGTVTKPTGTHNRRNNRVGRTDGIPPVEIPEWFLERRVVLRGRDLNFATFDHAYVLEHFDPRSQFLDHEYIRLDLESLKCLCQIACRSRGHDLTSQEFDEEIDPRIRNFVTRNRWPWPAWSKELQELVIGPHTERRAVVRRVFGEVEHTVRACLELADTAPKISSHAGRANLILDSPDDNSDLGLLHLVERIALSVGADVVHLDAQDIAQLLGDYVGEDNKTSHQKIRDLGFDAYRLRSHSSDDAMFSEGAEDENEDDSHAFSSSIQSLFGGAGPRAAVGKAALPMDAFRKLGKVVVVGESPLSAGMLGRRDSGNQHPNKYDMQVEKLKIGAWLDALFDLPQRRREAKTAGKPSTKFERPLSRSFFDHLTPLRDPYSETSKNEVTHHSLFHNTLLYTLERTEDGRKHLTNFSLAIPHARSGTDPEGYTDAHLLRSVVSNDISPKTIICVRDIKEIDSTDSGGAVLSQLREVIRQRRAKGEKVMMIGTSASRILTPELSKEGINATQSEGGEEDSRTIFVPGPDAVKSVGIPSVARFLREQDLMLKDGSRPNAQQMRNANINLRNILSMMTRLGCTFDSQLSLSGYPRPQRARNEAIMANQVLSSEDVHRIALIAIGMRASIPGPKVIYMADVFKATCLKLVSDGEKYAALSSMSQKQSSMKSSASSSKANLGSGDDGKPNFTEPSARDVRVSRLEKQGNKYEKRLLPGVVNPSGIRTTFADVHVPTETVDALKTLTSLSLSRPDAFKYGVLARDKLNGLLLYGPPGVGKTLLARAVAKESQATVLEVSGSEVNDMYVGEGEKNVRAVFSVARQLSPCIVFIDEADAIFASRAGGERRSHRALINQFLKEWDGMSETDVFVMVATNRPFDLDDAVLRRLPRRLLVDLPTKDDRESIFRIHLKDEQLDAAISLPQLAEETNLYSGSDIKNLCVAAALACVKEENANARKRNGEEIRAEETISSSPQDNLSTNTVPAGEVATTSPALETATDSHTDEVVANDAFESQATEHTDNAEASTTEPDFDVEAEIQLREQELVNRSTQFSNLLVPSKSQQPSSESTDPIIEAILSSPTPTSTSPKPAAPPTPSLYPARRTLHPRHFEIALREITASISEDMSSLRAIKKFDEQYGDRGGQRKKKSSWGFGIVDEEAERKARDGAARVRGGAPGRPLETPVEAPGPI